MEKQLKQLLHNYYAEIQNPNFLQKPIIVYASSMSPVEILRAFGFHVYFPENHAAIIGSKRLSDESIQTSLQKLPFNENCCSYMLSDIGTHFTQNSPLNNYQLPPKPDLIVYNTNQCLEIKHWLDYYGQLYQVPIIEIKTPHLIERNDTATIQFVKTQLEDMIHTIENLYKIKFNYENLKNTLNLSSQCSHLWQQIHDKNRFSPAPLSFFDLCRFMAPAVLLRGDQRANHFYQNLLHSLEQTSETAKVEHYRLLWAGMPIWGKQRYLSNYFTQLNTSIVNSIYTSSWIFKFDPTNPLTTMAKAYSELFINLNEKEKFIFLKHIIQNWNVQGVIFHHSHSCKRNSDNTYGIGQRILKELYIPSITIEADHNNLKYFNTRHFTTSIEALLEQIKSMNSIKEKKSK